MVYKNIFNINRAGRKTVSCYARTDKERLYDEVIIGFNIKPENIRTRRFDDTISICQNSKEIKDVLAKYGITRIVNNRYLDDIKKYMKGL